MFNKIEKKEIDNSPPVVFFPTRFEDLDGIISTLKTGHNVIVNVKNMEDRMKYRILDFLSGYAYAKNLKREKLDIWIYLFQKIK